MSGGKDWNGRSDGGKHGDCGCDHHHDGGVLVTIGVDADVDAHLKADIVGVWANADANVWAGIHVG